MKFDVQLASYLYENKTLRLEGIGTFTLDSKVSVPHEQEKEIFYPIEGLSFTYNPKASTEEDLIVYLVKKLHKIEPLIRSDIESYLSNIRQFINLGKPYTIEGVGTLSKNNQGAFEFTPGNFLPVKEELNPKRENLDHNYPIRSQSSAGRVLVVILIVVAGLAALGGIGWGIYSLVKNRSSVSERFDQQGSVDTLSQGSPETRTISPVPGPELSEPAETNLAGHTRNTDTANYKMVFEITPSRQRAFKRTTQLQSFHTNSRYNSLRIKNSLFYRLYIPVRIRSADTTRVKDSLRIFLGSRIRVIRQ